MIDRDRAYDPISTGDVGADNRIDGNPGHIGEDFVLPTQTYSFFTQPELSDWRCDLFGMGPTGITWTPNKGCEPNWFWRKMQWLVFGNRWYKVEAND